MKKSRLLSSLFALGTISFIVPIITTSCSNDDGKKNELSIAATGSLGGSSTLTNGMTLVGQLKDNDTAIFVLSGIVGASPKWTLSGGNVIAGQDYTVEAGDNKQEAILTIKNASKFTADTKYTISATVDNKSGSFTFNTPASASITLTNLNIGANTILEDENTILYTIPYPEEDGIFTLKASAVLTKAGADDITASVTINDVIDDKITGKLDGDNQTLKFTIKKDHSLINDATTMIIKVAGAKESVADYTIGKLKILHADDELIETNNYLETSDSKYYIANDFDPNILCGNTETISFKSPTKSGKGLQREINKDDVNNIIIKSIGTGVESVDDNFLNGFINISSIDISSLSTVTSIGTSLLHNCDNLTEVNLGSLNKTILPTDSESFATENKDAACYKKGIKFIYPDDENTDLWIWEKFIDNNSKESPYRKINASFNGMLYGGEKIVLENNIDPRLYTTYWYVSPESGGYYTRTYKRKNGDELTIDYKTDWSKLTQVFLTSADTSVKTLDGFFMRSCSNITTIDFSGLSSVTDLGGGFLDMCSGLTEVDLSPLSNVTVIGSYFLELCMKLTSVDLTPLSKVTRIEKNFLAKCIALKTVDLSPLSSATYIGDRFLWDCRVLENINLSVFKNVESIGNYFLAECASLKRISCDGLSSVKSIGSYFLYKCETVQYISLEGLSSINSIGDHCVCDCYDLVQIDFGDRINASMIADYDDNSRYSFSCYYMKEEDPKFPAWKDGVKITGANASGIKDAFPYNDGEWGGFYLLYYFRDLKVVNK